MTLFVFDTSDSLPVLPLVAIIRHVLLVPVYVIACASTPRYDPDLSARGVFLSESPDRDPVSVPTVCGYSMICVCMGGGETLLLDNFRGSAGFRTSESSPLSIMMSARLGRWSSLTFISRQVQAGARTARSTQPASPSQLPPQTIQLPPRPLLADPGMRKMIQHISI
jgi:hypothetical protein